MTSNAPHASLDEVVYRGEREPDGVRVTVVEGAVARPLPPRTDLINHSPTGFEWGYGGSGPAQLALAILAWHCRSDEEAVRWHQQFK